MRRRETFAVSVGICVCATVLLLSPLFSLAAPIELKAITFLPRAHKTAQPAKLFIDRMNEAAKGELVIKYLGGPEVIAGKDQPEAVRSGAVDILFCPSNWTAGAFNFREAEVVMNSAFSPIEERKNGFYDTMLELHKNKGLYYLGRFDWREEFYMWTTFPFTKPEDLKGHKLYVASSFIAVYKALGIAGVTVPTEEMYTAMERKTIEGTTLPLPPIRSFGIHELVKYCIDAPMHSSGLVCVGNLEKWNKLPKNLQDLVAKTYAKWEAEEMMPWYEQLYSTERKALQDKGVKFVKFSAEDAKRFNDIVEEAYWNGIEQKLGNKEYAARLRKLAGK